MRANFGVPTYDQLISKPRECYIRLAHGANLRSTSSGKAVEGHNVRDSAFYVEQTKGKPDHCTRCSRSKYAIPVPGQTKLPYGRTDGLYPNWLPHAGWYMGWKVPGGKSETVIIQAAGKTGKKIWSFAGTPFRSQPKSQEEYYVYIKDHKGRYLSPKAESSKSYLHFTSKKYKWTLVGPEYHVPMTFDTHEFGFKSKSGLYLSGNNRKNPPWLHGAGSVRASRVWCGKGLEAPKPRPVPAPKPTPVAPSPNPPAKASRRRASRPAIVASRRRQRRRVSPRSPTRRHRRRAVNRWVWQPHKMQPRRPHGRWVYRGGGSQPRRTQRRKGSPSAEDLEKLLYKEHARRLIYRARTSRLKYRYRVQDMIFRHRLRHFLRTRKGKCLMEGRCKLKRFLHTKKGKCFMEGGCTWK